MGKKIEELSINLRNEEFKIIRDFVKFRMSTMMILFHICLIISITILSGIGSIFLKLSDFELSQLNPYLLFLFLTPILFVITIFNFIICNRYDVQISGTYIQVFFEEKNYGPLWETHITLFRKKPWYLKYRNRIEAFDMLPYSFGLIIILSYFLYFSFLSKIFTTFIISPFNLANYINFIIFVIVPILPSIYFLNLFKKFKDTLKVRKEIYDIWKSIQEKESLK